ncbi:MAG: carboxypeptidase-like regulatory domain-containing protein, partial [Chitinophagaceae bacterium]
MIVHRANGVFRYCLLFVFILIGFATTAQVKILKGVIRDVHSSEKIPFASVEFQHTKKGQLSDSAGGFEFRFNEWPTDSILISYVGYQDFYIVIDSTLWMNAKDNVLDITVQLERGKYTDAVIVKRKIDRGYLMWKRIVKRKPFNDRYRFDNFGYELYNKLE